MWVNVGRTYRDTSHLRKAYALVDDGLDDLCNKLTRGHTCGDYEMVSTSHVKVRVGLLARAR